jgi:hypothetical protein
MKPTYDEIMSAVKEFFDARSAHDHVLKNWQSTADPAVSRARMRTAERSLLNVLQRSETEREYA